MYEKPIAIGWWGVYCHVTNLKIPFAWTEQFLLYIIPFLPVVIKTPNEKPLSVLVDLG